MVLINTILATTLLFAHGIHSYCVTNTFKDLSTFSLSISTYANKTQKYEFMVVNLQAGSTMCCPIEDGRCIHNNVGDSLVRFMIGLHHDPILRSAGCTSGGELIIGGTKEHTYAECVDMNGKSNMFTLDTVVFQEPFTFQDNTTWKYVGH